MRSARILLVVVVAVLAGCSQETPTPKPFGNVDTGRIIGADSEPGSWLSHGRTYSEQRYSPLDQINRHTVGGLGLAWAFEMNSSRGLEASPIVVDGAMFVTGAWSIVHAIDPQSGAELWRFDPQVPRNLARRFCCGVVNRGVAVWQGRVIVGTLDGRLISLDAATGEVVWEVDTLIDADRDYSITGAPRVANGKVFIGNGGADMGGVRGYASAYDAASGELVWRFFTVPGDPSLPFEHGGLATAAKTWNGEWWKTGGGGTVWNSIVYDPEFNQVYLGTGNGSPWNQQIRSPGGGDNLFLSSIVALDADSGSLQWYYQTTPADRWDFTATQDIILADLAIDGAQRKVLMQAPKNGFFYVLDRATGELLRANNYVQTNWATHVDMQTGRPVLNPDKDYYEKAVWVIPGSYGGHNWQPMAYDPVLRLAFIPAMEVPAVHEVKKSYARTGQFSMIPGAINTGTQFNLFDTTPAMDEGVPIPGITGALIAFDPVTGERRWAANQEQFWNGGVLATEGGLVFQGNGSGFLHAYDSESGHSVWSADVRTGIIAPPVTYAVEGEQYVAVLAGDGGAGNFVGDNFGEYEGKIAAVKYGNRGRLFAFKIGGTGAMPEIAATNLLIPEQPVLDVGVADITTGEDLYANFCATCHGAGVRGRTIADLRYMSDATHAVFDQIVLHGMRVNDGMSGYADILDEQDARHLHAYIVDTATRDRLAQQRKMPGSPEH